MDDTSDLTTKITAYETQLQQVQQYLSIDPSNAQFIKLRDDLTHVITLTKNLADIHGNNSSSSTSSSGGNVEQTENGDNEENSDEDDSDEENASAGIFVRKQHQSSSEVSSSLHFAIGDSVEVVSGERPYAAVILSIDESTKECTLKYYEYEAEVSLPLDGSIRKIPVPSKGALKDTDILPPNYKCFSKFAQDQRWYDAVVDSRTTHGYRVTYSQYGNSEEVPLNYLRSIATAANLTGKGGGKGGVQEQERPTVFEIPKKYLPLPTDTEQERLKKKKKIKALKAKFKDQSQESEIVEKKQNWQSFVTKGMKKSIPGVAKAKSMFASPEEVDGKVGVTNSGKGLTQFDQRKRFKLG